MSEAISMGQYVFALLVIASLICSAIWVYMLITSRKKRPLFGYNFETYLYASFGFGVVAQVWSWLSL